MKLMTNAALIILWLISSMPCQSAEPNCLAIISPFIPTEVLQKKGLDPNKLKFVKKKDRTAKRSVSHDGGIQRQYGDYTLEVTVTYDGENAGYLLTGGEYYLDVGKRSDPAIIADIQVEEKFKGKGLGAILYYYAAQKVYSETGNVMTMTWAGFGTAVMGLAPEANLASTEAQNAWGIFQNHQLAEKTDETLRFKEDILKSDYFSGAVNFVESRSTQQ